MRMTGRTTRAVAMAMALGVAAPAFEAPLGAQRGAATPAFEAKPTVFAPPPPALAGYKKELAAEIDAMATFTQQMVDQVFSFGELGFQEVETSKYLTTVLRQNGFTVEQGIAGIPTSWMATLPRYRSLPRSSVPRKPRAFIELLAIWLRSPPESLR